MNNPTKLLINSQITLNLTWGQGIHGEPEHMFQIKSWFAGLDTATNMAANTAALATTTSVAVAKFSQHFAQTSLLFSGNATKFIPQISSPDLVRPIGQATENGAWLFPRAQLA